MTNMDSLLLCCGPSNKAVKVKRGVNQRLSDNPPPVTDSHVGQKGGIVAETARR